MFKTIFVADDGRGRGRDALRLGRYLAARDTSFVIGPLNSTGDVAAVTQREGADLIVVGASRAAARLLHGAPIPVALAPRGYAGGGEDRIRVIGVGFDGQAESRAALHAAGRLALEQGATMRVFGVVQPGMPSDLEENLREEVETLDHDVRAAASVVRGDPVATLVERSREGLDLLVVGSRGHGPVRSVLFGSVSSRLAHACECPLLVLPRVAALEPDAESNLLGSGRGDE